MPFERCIAKFPTSTPLSRAKMDGGVEGGGGVIDESLQMWNKSRPDPQKHPRLEPRTQPSSCWWNSSNTSQGWELCYWLQSWRLLWLALGDPWRIWVSLMRCLACSSCFCVFNIPHLRNRARTENPCREQEWPFSYSRSLKAAPKILVQQWCQA